MSAHRRMRRLAVVTMLLALSPPLVARSAPILVVPTDFKVYERSLGGIVDIKVDDTEQTRREIDAALLRQLGKSGHFEPIALPALTDAERVVFEEHLALFDVVARQAALVVFELEWRHKRRRQFDYSIGPGLAFLADRTGAERVILVSGHLADSTGGRVVVGVVATATTRVPFLLNEGLLSVAIVDLRSGAFEWMNVANQFSGHGTRSPKTAGSADRLMSRVFRDYPRGGFQPEP